MINANLDGDLDPERFEHVAFYDERARSGSRCGCAPARDTSARIDALELDVALRGRRGASAPRSRASSRATRSAREYRDAGLELLDWYTDPDELFALSLTGPAGADAEAG